MNHRRSFIDDLSSIFHLDNEKVKQESVLEFREELARRGVERCLSPTILLGIAWYPNLYICSVGLLGADSFLERFFFEKRP